MFHAISLANVTQGTDEWKAARKSGIGGSDAASVIGVDDQNSDYFRSPLDVYNEKLGIVADTYEENWFSRRGKALEPELRRDYAEKTGRTVRLPEHILQHPVHKFMICSLDGFTDDGRIQEFKTASHSKGWGTEGTDEIPQKFLVQTQHNLIVTGAEVADVSVSIGGMAPKYYEIPADRELQQLIIDSEENFWSKVMARIEPDPITIEEMKRKFIIHEGLGVNATPNIAQLVIQLREMKHIEKTAGIEIEKTKEMIQKFLLENGAEILIDPSTLLPLITWKQGKGRASFDSKSLQSSMPEVYAQFSKIGAPVRTFLIK